MELMSQTSSLCLYCLRRISARRVTEDNAVYLEKSYPEHGDLAKVLWGRQHWRTFG
jgi:7,8-dihydro-6-hydroxymethylpterin dimethyltransferase